MQYTTPQNIKKFKKTHDIVSPFNIVIAEDERIMENDVYRQGLKQHKKTQTQYRRNKIFHKFIKNTLQTESITASTYWNGDIDRDETEGNENKFLSILDSGWEIRKTTLYLIQATIPVDTDDLSIINCWLERTPVGGTTEDLAFFELEGTSITTGLPSDLEKLTINLHYVGELVKGDIVTLQNNVRANSSNGSIQFGRQLGTLSLVSLSY